MTKIPMLSHVSVGVANVGRAKAFYDAVLGTLGYRRLMGGSYGYAWGISFPAFWAQKPFNGKRPTTGNGVHVCFNAKSKTAVDAFYTTALKRGGRCDGPPGLRIDYTANYYAAFVKDPDGNKIEALCFLSKKEMRTLKSAA
ncbi:MAG: VOC family protein [Rhodospirillaceae bacterium]|nr:VOC family protein [Rhodospirillaceae bacterium]